MIIRDLSELSPIFRYLTALFIITVLIGFIVGLIYLGKNTEMQPAGISAFYRGNEDNLNSSQYQFAKSLQSLLITTHNHLLGLATIFFLLGFLYLHLGSNTKFKKFVATEPFISLLFTFGGIWMMRFIHPLFVYLVIISGALMFICIFWMGLVILKSCFRKKAG
jgi:hypothetical protein